MALHILALGGSLIVPEEIDTEYLAAFKQFIIRRIEKGDRFIIIAGGGKTARKYQQAAATVSGIDNEEKDWLGLHSTRLNAHLLRTIFKLWAHPKLMKNYDRDLVDLKFDEKILVGAGWKPGWSTDYISVLLAQHFEAKTIINLSNMDYVYSEDPKVNPEAKKYDKLSWKDFKNIVGDTWDPGMSAPFDPVATKKAADMNLEVAIMNGKNLANLGEYLDGKKFKGTVIKN